MNRIKLFAALACMILVSCSQEEIIHNSGAPMAFRVGMSSRANPDLYYTTPPATFYVTGYVDSHKAVNGVVPAPYIENEMFTKDTDITYTSTNNTQWPEKGDNMEFFAYAPSLTEIREAAYTQLNKNSDQYEVFKKNYNDQISFFNMCNAQSTNYDPFTGSNTLTGVELYSGYKLGRFYVASDISKQVDFITAHVSARTPRQNEDIPSVELVFKHQLSNIEIQAFSGNPTYNIEIAGVRIGGAFTGNAIFNFCDKDGNVSNPEGGMWGISKNPQRIPVEYIYQSGDEIYRMGTYYAAGMTVSPHISKDLAKTIMGNGGNAMVLPTKNAAWAGMDNPWISTVYEADPDKNPLPWDPETQGDMYFSILVHVTVKETGTMIYPYSNNSTMHVVDIYKDKNSNKVLGNSLTTNVVPANSEKIQFGWVTMPVSVDWKRGYKYIYTLDFTEGIGIQDPGDHNPGAPIIGSGIKFSVSIDDWKAGNGQGEDFKVPDEYEKPNS